MDNLLNHNNGEQRAVVEVTGHKAHGPIPEPGSVVIARVSPALFHWIHLCPYLKKKRVL